MGESGFRARRTTKCYRQTINAPPEEVFPLICPVREAEWLDGWRYSMLYSESGLAEEGAVFSTPGDGEAETVWIVTRHDPERREVEFTRFTPGSRICVLRIAVTEKGAGSSSVAISYTYTATTPSGNRFIDGLTEEAFLDAMRFWEKSMNHFLKTGGRLAKG
jgi:hypothetical protein